MLLLLLVWNNNYIKKITKNEKDSTKNITKPKRNLR